ncbi:MAG: hypothetical protein JWL69_3593 [Phycisphaerales bacterium]|nr:hypothetical protein [Phycisphaerales bacterium]MDB5355962.1 hypothetical protein [Phycisphaerales bacterium]
MPLLDHFNPPLSKSRHWESFLASWSTTLADVLNGPLLPRDYFAEIHVHVGSRVEVDIASFDDSSGGRGARTRDAEGGGVATAPIRTWSPPAPAMAMPAIFPDSIEVLVYSEQAGPTLVAAVELISPGNKDRPETRRAFAAKCATYLHEGIGLIVVDIVTSRSANLHNELVELLAVGHEFIVSPDDLYAVAYRPVRRKDVEKIDVWPTVLALGGTLPLLPLSLDKNICIPLDLEPTYAEACQRSRLP